MEGMTRSLANFAVKLRFEDLPKDVVGRVKLNTLNILGKALAGYITCLAPPYIHLGKGMGSGRRDSTLIGDGDKIACAPAAFVNSSLATMLDYDDTLFWSLIHPGNASVAAALAVGEVVQATGKEFITSIVLGYEIAGRIALAVKPTVERWEKVYGLGYQAFAAAPPAGKLLGLNGDQMTSALGITGTYTTVPSVWKYLGRGSRPMREVKMAWGWNCMVGVFSALAAKEGLKMLQPSNVLDGEEGWWIMHGSDQCDFEKMTEELGERYDILKTAIKPYPTCYWIFSPCDAVGEALKKQKIIPERIKEINVKGMSVLRDKLSDVAPKGFVDAQFSTEWAIAMMILGVEPGPEWYSEENLRNPEALDLASKVKYEVDPNADRLWLEEGKQIATVRIATNDGKKEVMGYVEYPKGELANPFTPEEIKDTFRRLASYILDPEHIERIIETVGDLEKVTDISMLARLLHPGI
jgi:2-methylcitrate dehydratase PrpD